jgi:hypothetical protein
MADSAKNRKAMKNNSGSCLIIAIIIIVAIVFLRKWISKLCVNFFIRVDNMLNANESISPIIMWGLFGLLIGATIGALVVAKKYRLKTIWRIPAFAILLGFLIMLLSLKKPLGDNIRLTRYTYVSGSNYVEVTASRTIPNYKNYNYGAQNLIDGDNRTSWMYVDANGKSETVNMIFSKGKTDNMDAMELAAFHVVNGFVKERSKWSNYNRVRDYTIYRNNEAIVSGTLLDEFKKNQQILLPNLKVNRGDTIKFQVNSVYLGKRKNVNITALTELYPFINYSKSN